MSLLAPPPPTPQTYHWLGTGGPDSSMWILFRGTDQIGQYDVADNVYRRVNTDGTFSDPSPRPWRTHPSLVPPPAPLVAKQAKAKEHVALAAETLPKEENEPRLQAAAEEEEETNSGKSPVEKLLQTMPPWSLYTAGGGLAGAALLFGFVAYGRRK